MTINFFLKVILALQNQFQSSSPWMWVLILSVLICCLKYYSWVLPCHCSLLSLEQEWHSWRNEMSGQSTWIELVIWSCHHRESQASTANRERRFPDASNSSSHHKRSHLCFRLQCLWPWCIYLYFSSIHVVNNTDLGPPRLRPPRRGPAQCLTTLLTERPE